VPRGKCFGNARFGTQNSRREIVERDGFGHHGVGQPNAERPFESEEQLDAFQAADAKITVDRIIERRHDWRTTELTNQLADGRQQLSLDTRSSSRSGSFDWHRATGRHNRDERSTQRAFSVLAASGSWQWEILRGVQGIIRKSWRAPRKPTGAVKSGKLEQSVLTAGA
jgi:hypothetical protein